MIFDKDNACRVNKLSNEIGDQVRYILRSEVILPMYPRRAARRYDAVALAVDLQGRSKAGRVMQSGAPIRSRASTRYISVPP